MSKWTGAVALAMVALVGSSCGCHGLRAQRARGRHDHLLGLPEQPDRSVPPVQLPGGPAVQREVQGPLPGQDRPERRTRDRAPQRLQYYQRLALANALPDVFLLQRSELQTLEGTGKLFDFSQGAWPPTRPGGSSFYPGSFAALTDKKGRIFAIPEERDSIGIYYNKALFAKAGICAFPATWAEFTDDCAKLKAAGITCFAMDGNWVTLLMWANLIGTPAGRRRSSC